MLLNLTQIFYDECRALDSSFADALALYLTRYLKQDKSDKPNQEDSPSGPSPKDLEKIA